MMKIRSRLIPTATALLAALLVPATAAAAAPGSTGPVRPNDSGYVHVIDYHSNQCLAVPGGSTDAGARLMQWYCNDAVADHYWNLVPAFTDHFGRTFYHLVNLNDGQCLALPGGTTEAGTQVMQWPCGDYPDHYWTLQYIDTTSRFHLINYNSGQCLSIGGGSTDLGAPVTQWPCGTGDDQLWRLG